MLTSLPDVIVKEVALFLRPEDALAVIRTCKEVYMGVKPLLKDIRRYNDGVGVGTKVLYRDFRLSVGVSHWPQWGSLVGVVTAIQTDGTYIIDGRIRRKKNNIRRLRTFYTDVAMRVIDCGKQYKIRCCGCYDTHRHGRSLGGRSPHCAEWKRHFPVSDYWLSN